MVILLYIDIYYKEEDPEMSIKMTVETRTGIGSNKVKKLRDDNIIPAVIYSRGEETRHIKVDNLEFTKVFREAGTSTIIDLAMGEEILPVIVKEVQRHPVKQQVVHVDFQKLNMNEKVKMSIPITLLNRDSIKLQPSILMQFLDQVDIECLPGDIPQAAELDVEDIDFSTPKFVKDLSIANDEKITILTDLEVAVCSLSEPTVHVDEDEETEEALVDVQTADRKSVV